MFAFIGRGRGIGYCSSFICAYIDCGGIGYYSIPYSRLASKTTDVNWSKAKDMGDHMGYYENR